MGAVTDPPWADVADVFDPVAMGRLPDVWVPGVSAADWQALLDLVVARGWWHEYAEGCRVLPLPTAARVLSRPSGAEVPTLCVEPAPGFRAIFRFLSDETIDFDIDLYELRGQERLDVFCGFLRAIGRRLDRTVFLCPEGAGVDVAVLWYEPGADRIAVRHDR
ncbi:hypothetical protein ACIF70_28960 [Actinacidiphila glaucinigra]|uniref:hypothetical protein n=1 Tax=Actinacidiphila glaucinigra TaxID=235986 RepID=UPI002DDA32C0|nr:hypothetical protein [Actinacidiphila glaucinigra]WSD60755.1 hypothetical protein OIE69_18405 [Actinacidiphila glaucinigra]